MKMGWEMVVFLSGKGFIPGVGPFVAFHCRSNRPLQIRQKVLLVCTGKLFFVFLGKLFFVVFIES